MRVPGESRIKGQLLLGAVALAVLTVARWLFW